MRTGRTIRAGAVAAALTWGITAATLAGPARAEEGPPAAAGAAGTAEPIALDDDDLTTVPDDARYAFLGTPGTRLWELSLAALPADTADTADTPDTSDTPDTPEAAEAAEAGPVTLTALAGPAPVAVYETSGSAAPEVLLAAGQELPAGGVELTGGATGDLSGVRWAFTAPGEYELALAGPAGTETAYAVRVAAPAATDTTGASRERTVLDEGHIDIAARVLDGDLHIHVKDGTVPGSSTWREPGALVLHVKPEAEQQVPDNPQFAFLGDPGDPVWLLDQVQQEGLLWPGWSTEHIPAGATTGPVEFRLDSVSGPGDLALWTYDVMDGATVLFNSGDGTPDAFDVPQNTHAHGGWAFTEEGTYQVTLSMTATLSGGGKISDTETFAFAVGATDPGTVTPPGDSGSGGGSATGGPGGSGGSAGPGASGGSGASGGTGGTGGTAAQGASGDAQGNTQGSAQGGGSRDALPDTGASDALAPAATALALLGLGTAALLLTARIRRGHREAAR
ncbi:choice-of-anchor M domain-containing protein [Streptomyces sp. YIM 98790]|uniref:choice-of-anchor M domain-containing protein n=1 Tax=Streptomyces sp. YIM 98790 TaxID=2689077 RepID=UPI00140AE742|nr:choice-of-anchor M domain-containing protein [Streptomyces sp. YIM 98790]